MTQALTAPNDVERKLAGVLKDRSEKAIQRRNDPDAVAQQLDIARSGLEALLWQQEWTLEQAIRVAVALGVVDETLVETLARQDSV